MLRKLACLIGWHSLKVTLATDTEIWQECCCCGWRSASITLVEFRKRCHAT
jgi:hypothetical protein